MNNAHEPAFPGPSDNGLTKREYFAGLAMQGLLSNLKAIREEGFRDPEIAEFAVMQANVLLAELQKATA